MSDASPQWEYTWFHSAGDDALNEMMRKANALGEQGWEMVNFAVDERKPFTAVCFFKTASRSRAREAGTSTFSLNTPDSRHPHIHALELQKRCSTIDKERRAVESLRRGARPTVPARRGQERVLEKSVRNVFPA
jgi:hypothetical protein